MTNLDLETIVDKSAVGWVCCAVLDLYLSCTQL